MAKYLKSKTVSLVMILLLFSSMIFCSCSKQVKSQNQNQTLKAPTGLKIIIEDKQDK